VDTRSYLDVARSKLSSAPRSLYDPQVDADMARIETISELYENDGVDLPTDERGRFKPVDATQAVVLHHLERLDPNAVPAQRRKYRDEYLRSHGVVLRSRAPMARRPLVRPRSATGSSGRPRERTHAPASSRGDPDDSEGDGDPEAPPPVLRDRLTLKRPAEGAAA
jgi:hypothetical protein